MLTEFKHFIRRSCRLATRAKKLLAERPTDWQFIYNTEGLISDAWQSWNLFCRNLLVKSCQGCHGRQGTQYAARPSMDNSLERIALEVKLFGNGAAAPPPPGKKIANAWAFPTWGDGAKIINAVNGLNTQNNVALMTAFGLPLQGHVELQRVRNFLFHKSNIAAHGVMNLQYYQHGVMPSHPALLVWELNQAHEIIFFVWLDDMKHIALHATM